MTEIHEYKFGITVEINDKNLTAVVKVKGGIVKKFSGETAWSDAIRYAQDIEHKIDMKD